HVLETSISSPRTAALSRMNFWRVSLLVSVVILYLSDFLEIRLVALAARRITGGAGKQALRILFRQGAHDLGRRTQDQRIVREFLALGDHGAGADQATLADLRPVQHHGLDADQRAVAHRAAMQHRLVAD